MRLFLRNRFERLVRNRGDSRFVQRHDVMIEVPKRKGVQVRQANGNVLITSELGKGTQVVIHLPRTR